MGGAESACGRQALATCTLIPAGGELAVSGKVHDDVFCETSGVHFLGKPAASSIPEHDSEVASESETNAPVKTGLTTWPGIAILQKEAERNCEDEVWPDPDVLSLPTLERAAKGDEDAWKGLAITQKKAQGLGLACRRAAHPLPNSGYSPAMPKIHSAQPVILPMRMIQMTPWHSAPLEAESDDLKHQGVHAVANSDWSCIRVRPRCCKDDTEMICQETNDVPYEEYIPCAVACSAANCSDLVMESDDFVPLVRAKNGPARSMLRMHDGD
mmetsp:Transcript_136159/g.236683  ORF Transcript_136159/g.236683 Transcript_136159/m.236683 type:complete len:270 (-) Transcript_136159:56-865(-)